MKKLPALWYHKTIGFCKLLRMKNKYEADILPIHHNRSPAGKPVTINRKDLYLKETKYNHGVKSKKNIACPKCKVRGWGVPALVGWYKCEKCGCKFYWE